MKDRRIDILSYPYYAIAGHSLENFKLSSSVAQIVIAVEIMA